MGGWVELQYHPVKFYSLQKNEMRWRIIFVTKTVDYTNDLVQDCSNSLANALELLQSRTKPTYFMV